MKKVTDLTGKKYGLLTVISLSKDYIKGPARWLCKCECGNETVVFASNLNRLHTTSCGCVKKANFKTMNLKHGATAGKMDDKNSYPSSYKIWCNMRQRCYDPNSPVYHHYGGRGITICDRWNDYANFAEDMGEKPAGLTLDRINNNGPYSPENCRWVSMKTQSINRRTNHLISYQGETKSLAEWAAHLGVPRGNLHNRIFRGWDIHRAFTQPYRKQL